MNCSLLIETTRQEDISRGKGDSNGLRHVASAEKSKLSTFQKNLNFGWQPYTTLNHLTQNWIERRYALQVSGVYPLFIIHSLLLPSTKLYSSILSSLRISCFYNFLLYSMLITCAYSFTLPTFMLTHSCITQSNTLHKFTTICFHLMFFFHRWFLNTIRTVMVSFQKNLGYCSLS